MLGAVDLAAGSIQISLKISAFRAVQSISGSAVDALLGADGGLVAAQPVQLAAREIPVLPAVSDAPHLTVLPAGQPDRDPIAGLTSERMRAILAQAAERFDWVIVDTPPVGLISDARLLAALADGVLLVAGAGSTSYRLIEHAVEELGRDRIIGAVLNRVDAENIALSDYDNYYYGHSGGTQS